MAGDAAMAADFRIRCGKSLAPVCFSEARIDENRACKKNERPRTLIRCTLNN
jgi:hypothetical protein